WILDFGFWIGSRRKSKIQYPKSKIAWPRAAKLGVLLVALAYSGNFAYVLEQLLGTGGRTSGDLGVAARDLGELVALLVPVALFAATSLPEGRWRNRRRWALPALLALLFSAGSIVDALTNKGYTSLITAWSLG